MRSVLRAALVVATWIGAVVLYVALGAAFLIAIAGAFHAARLVVPESWLVAPDGEVNLCGISAVVLVLMPGAIVAVAAFVA